MPLLSSSHCAPCLRSLFGDIPDDPEPYLLDNSDCESETLFSEQSSDSGSGSDAENSLFLTPSNQAACTECGILVTRGTPFYPIGGTFDTTGACRDCYPGVAYRTSIQQRLEMEIESCSSKKNPKLT